MKKITAIILSLIFIFSFSACKGNDKATDTDTTVYIGEGKSTVVRTLLKTNFYFANEVFGENHLIADESKAVSNENGSYIPVTDEKFKSYSELKALVDATYTEEAADKLLEEKRYAEINGKLHLNMNFMQSGKKKYNYSELEIICTDLSDDGIYTFTVNLKDAKDKDISLEVKVIESNGAFRLCEFYI